MACSNDTLVGARHQPGDRRRVKPACCADRGGHEVILRCGANLHSETMSEKRKTPLTCPICSDYQIPCTGGLRDHLQVEHGQWRVNRTIAGEIITELINRRKANT